MATLNIGGGEKTFDEFTHQTQQSRQEALDMLVRRLDADILCLQEVTQYIDAEGITHSLMDVVDRAGHYTHAFFGKNISMETHLVVKKDVMIKGIFSDWREWSLGNAIHARLPFARLGDPTRPGEPRQIPLFRPPAYEGTRDTDPRSVLLTRLKESPYPFVSTLHLSTLVGERPPDMIPKKKEQAQMMRYDQIGRFLDLVRADILERDQPLILTGDFNATADEASLRQLLERQPGFVRLQPENDGPTHPDLPDAVDHIFFYPQTRLVDYSCRIESDGLSRRASDHLPVVAELQIK